MYTGGRTTERAMGLLNREKIGAILFVCTESHHNKVMTFGSISFWEWRPAAICLQLGETAFQPRASFINTNQL